MTHSSRRRGGFGFFLPSFLIFHSHQNSNRLGIEQFSSSSRFRFQVSIEPKPNPSLGVDNGVFSNFQLPSFGTIRAISCAVQNHRVPWPEALALKLLPPPPPRYPPPTPGPNHPLAHSTRFSWTRCWAGHDDCCFALYFCIKANTTCLPSLCLHCIAALPPQPPLAPALSKPSGSSCPPPP